MKHTAWNHLSNAVLIDRILHDVVANPADWTNAWVVSRDASNIAAWSVAWDAAMKTVRIAGRREVWDAAWNAACSIRVKYIATIAILALIAWDEAGDYLSMPSDQVQILALLGDKKAVLMWPAVMVFDESKELEVEK